MDKDFKEKLKKIHCIELSCTCYRAISKEYKNPLSAEGSKKASGRWHIKGEFEALYLSESRKVCIEELKRRVDDDTLIENLFDIFKIEINVSKILDLTSKESLEILEIGENQLLSGSIYELNEVRLPNNLARTAYKLGFEGILVKSASLIGNNVIIFPENLLKESRITVKKNAVK